MRGIAKNLNAVRLEPLEARRLFSFDLLLDSAGLSATSAVVVNGTSYFFADDGLHGRELWRDDRAGTMLVKDLTPGAGSTTLHSFYQGSAGRAVFLTTAPVDTSDTWNNLDYTLWSTDGSAAGTVKLASFRGGSWLFARQVGDRVAILAHNGSAQSTSNATFVDAHLWFTDGTAEGTSRVKSFLASSEQTFQATALLVAGDRVLFDFGRSLWASDGTAGGTIDLTARVGEVLSPLPEDVVSSFPPPTFDLTTMVEFNGSVLLPTPNIEQVVLTDGTIDGTVARPFNVEGTLEGKGYSAVAGSKYFYVTLVGDQKLLKALNLDTGEQHTVYAGTGDSSNIINIYSAGARLIFTDSNSNDGTITFGTTNGTLAGTSVLRTFTGYPVVARPVTIDGASFFVVAYGPYEVDAENTSGVFGWIGTEELRVGQDIRPINLPGVSHIELWRTDGTIAGTGAVRELWSGDADGRKVTAQLTAARGKLVAHTKVTSGVNSLTFPNDAQLTTEFDDTQLYDPNELMLGRATASARLINGNLRLGGSMGDDRIRVWRSLRMPDRLVVESNGNFRSFPFDSINKIIADLQSGNDYFEILEGEGGLIRFRTSVFGGDGMDTIITGVGRDTISGGTSGDLIRSRGNADEIIGGAGRDRINGGVGDDSIAGGSGNDQVIGAAGVDVLFGQSALEAVFGKEQEGERVLDDVLLA